MPLNIRREEVSRLAEKVAALARVSKTEAVRIALSHEVERLEGKPSLLERLRPARERIARYPDTGLEADKAFFDELKRRTVMFVDASAIVAILAGENEDVALFRCLETAGNPITSALAIFEAASLLCRKKDLSVEAAETEVRGLLSHASIRVVPVTDIEPALA